MIIIPTKRLPLIGSNKSKKVISQNFSSSIPVNSSSSHPWLLCVLIILAVGVLSGCSDLSHDSNDDECDEKVGDMHTKEYMYDPVDVTKSKYPPCPSADAGINLSILSVYTVPNYLAKGTFCDIGQIEIFIHSGRTLSDSNNDYIYSNKLTLYTYNQTSLTDVQLCKGRYQTGKIISVVRPVNSTNHDEQICVNITSETGNKFYCFPEVVNTNTN